MAAPRLIIIKKNDDIDFTEFTFRINKEITNVNIPNTLFIENDNYILINSNCTTVHYYHTFYCSYNDNYKTFFNISPFYLNNFYSILNSIDNCMKIIKYCRRRCAYLNGLFNNNTDFKSNNDLTSFVLLDCLLSNFHIKHLALPSLITYNTTSLRDLIQNIPGYLGEEEKKMCYLTFYCCEIIRIYNENIVVITQGERLRYLKILYYIFNITPSSKSVYFSNVQNIDKLYKISDSLFIDPDKDNLMKYLQLNGRGFTLPRRDEDYNKIKALYQKKLDKIQASISELKFDEYLNWFKEFYQHEINTFYNNFKVPEDIINNNALINVNNVDIVNNNNNNLFNINISVITRNNRVINGTINLFAILENHYVIIKNFDSQTSDYEWIVTNYDGKYVKFSKNRDTNENQVKVKFLYYHDYLYYCIRLEFPIYNNEKRIITGIFAHKFETRN